MERLIDVHRPYSFEELSTVTDAHIYLEYRQPEYSSGYRRTAWIRAWMGSEKGPNRALYGKTWRCWEKEPTREETLGAEWRGDDG